MVLDLSRLLPGGYATHLLAEMGARVIKIEDPVRGDYLREFPFPLDDGMSAYFHAINRGKESVVLDLKKSPEVLLQLASHADVVIEGFRPGVVDRLGIGYDVVSKRNPSIVYCSVTGYEPTGDYRHRAGHDINYLGVTGLIDINRGQDGRPAMAGLQIADIASGSLLAVCRILRALVERVERGHGEHVEVDMVSGTASLMTFIAAPFVLGGRSLTWDDLLLNGQVACYNLYPTSDGRWMSMGNLEDKFWISFCNAVGRESWVPRQFERTREFHAEVAALFRRRSQADWVAVFANVDTCIEPIVTLNEAAAKGMFRYQDKPAPRLGEHTRTVLEEFGLSDGAAA
ncbi:MAG: CaiB/BaiF CoA transferase family protein [Gemmatimonadaceae bacterium]